MHWQIAPIKISESEREDRDGFSRCFPSFLIMISTLNSSWNRLGHYSKRHFTDGEWAKTHRFPDGCKRNGSNRHWKSLWNSWKTAVQFDLFSSFSLSVPPVVTSVITVFADDDGSLENEIFSRGEKIASVCIVENELAVKRDWKEMKEKEKLFWLTHTR